jgi:hypothetical protein
MKDIRLIVPDELHAKAHYLATLATVPVAAVYPILAVFAMEAFTDPELVELLKRNKDNIGFERGRVVFTGVIETQV